MSKDHETSTDYFYLGSRPLEPCEAEGQWFVVGSSDAGGVGDENILFPSYDLAIEYINWKNERNTQ